MASWLVRSTPERMVWVWALSGDIVLCSWARHLTLTVPLFTQVYKWVPANCWGNLANCGGVTCDGLASRPGEAEILLAASCYRNPDKLRQLWATLAPRLYLKKKSRNQDFNLGYYGHYAVSRGPVITLVVGWRRTFGENLFKCYSRFLSIPLIAIDKCFSMSSHTYSPFDVYI